MIYYLDTEFDANMEHLLSLALVEYPGKRGLYITFNPDHKMDNPWVEDNVMPIMYSNFANIPKYADEITYRYDMDSHDPVDRKLVGDLIAKWINEPKNGHNTIVTDWPADIIYFCKAIMYEDGIMAKIDNLRFEMNRVDAYPTTIQDAVQHNALWDAIALKQKYTED